MESCYECPESLGQARHYLNHSGEECKLAFQQLIAILRIRLMQCKQSSIGWAKIANMFAANFRLCLITRFLAGPKKENISQELHGQASVLDVWVIEVHELAKSFCSRSPNVF